VEVPKNIKEIEQLDVKTTFLHGDLKEKKATWSNQRASR